MNSETRKEQLRDRALDTATDVRVLAQAVKDAITSGGDVRAAADALRGAVIRLDLAILELRP